MKTVSTIAELRAELRAVKDAGALIGLVPTMGALHEGHLSLIDRSVRECDITVVTIFVNPTQFRAGEDLDKYPRQLERDTALAATCGADLLFTPSADEIYPAGFDSSVAVRGITETLCGAPERRGHEHFDGVTTVVAKLLNIAAPDRAYFGQKDAQQVAVIRRMAQDLNFPAEIVTCPTVRETDGLAMSSRNAYLPAEDRERALALFNALSATRATLATGQRDAGELTRVALGELAFTDEVEYVELVDPETLKPVSRIERPALLAIAARISGTRLIDNLILDPATAGIDHAMFTHPTPQGAAI